MAVVPGAVFFGEFPDPWTIVGAGIIVATGLFSLHDELVVERRNGTACGAVPADSGGTLSPADAAGEDGR